MCGNTAGVIFLCGHLLVLFGSSCRSIPNLAPKQFLGKIQPLAILELILSRFLGACLCPGSWNHFCAATCSCILSCLTDSSLNQVQNRFWGDPVACQASDQNFTFAGACLCPYSWSHFCAATCSCILSRLTVSSLN